MGGANVALPKGVLWIPLTRRRNWRALLSLMVSAFGVWPSFAFGGPVGGQSLALDRRGEHRSLNQLVWYSPADESPDLLDMFRQPDAWKKARAKVELFKLSPEHFETEPSATKNSLRALVEVRAFTLLRQWGIGLAAEEGAVKEWDCTGQTAAAVTTRHIRNLKAVGASFAAIAMDEPLASGIGPCRQSLAETALRTTAYIASVKRSAIVAGEPIPVIGDIEPYPSIEMTRLRDWISQLSNAHGTIGFFHLDIDMNDVRHLPALDVLQDLRRLESSLREARIPFGIIIWSGQDPLVFDEEFFKDAGDLVALISRLPYKPDQLVFESWVTRAPKSCRLPRPRCDASSCSANDPIFCGKKSIPVNLPDHGPDTFSLTKLLLDSLAELQ